MLKYFSTSVERPINTGGRKVMYDMHKAIITFLINERIQYKEYSFSNLRVLIHMILPDPHANYLLFGYIGTPIFNTPFVVLYFFIFCFIALKKRLAREKFYLIIVDLLEWQSTLRRNNKGKIDRYILRIFRILLERILVSYVADEIISLIDNDFLMKHYKINNIYDLEFVDYYITHARNLNPIKSTNRLNILYAGDLSRSFDIEFLEEILKNLNNSCNLLVAGYGLKKHFEKRLRKYQNFYFLGQLDVETLDKVARECHFGLIAYLPEYLYYNITSSSKLAFYIANGLTVISTNLKRTKKLNEKYDFGYVLNKEKLIKLIKELSQDKIKRKKILEDQITNGKFLYDVLNKLDFNRAHENGAR